MGLELVIFILIGSVSIFAAVMMLISDNAVHSALFLILNFATVAFMYLMLHAPFLALVQVTVYAGAIMVLFLFVIMLLGAEKVLPKPNQQYRWTTPAAVGIVVIILLIASVAILQSEVDDSEQHPDAPIVRFVHSDTNMGPVDIYLGEAMLANGLEFTDSTDFEHVEAGERNLVVVEHGAAPAESEALIDEALSLEDGQVFSMVLLPEAINGSRILQVEDSLEPLETRGTTRLTVVNAAASCPDGCVFDLADVSREGESPNVIAEGLAYGTVVEPEALYRDRYDDHLFSLAAFAPGAIEAARSGEEDTSADLDPIVRQPSFEVADNHSMLWVITTDARADVLRYRTIFEESTNSPRFGSARGVGQLLFTTYLLPFELIALLLLVAMIGVIILTKDDDDRRRRRRNERRMAAIPGTPTVEEYLKAVEAGQPLPPPTTAKQLPESSGD